MTDAAVIASPSRDLARDDRSTRRPVPAGAELTAHIAAMLTVQDGLIREHETFDCYEPPPRATE